METEYIRDLEPNKVCSKCHRELPLSSFYKNRSQKDGLTYQCKDCCNVMDRLHHQRNREKRNKQSRDWKVNNKERVLETSRLYEEAHKEEHRASCRAWRVANPEKVREGVTCWRKANPERAREISARWHEANHEKEKLWRIANPEKIRRKQASRRARKAAVVCESIDPIEILERDKWHCKLCGCKTPKKLRGTTEPNAPVIDHIVPLALGGPHTRRNLQCLCWKCNRTKSFNYEGQLAFA